MTSSSFIFRPRIPHLRRSLLLKIENPLLPQHHTGDFFPCHRAVGGTRQAWARATSVGLKVRSVDGKFARNRACAARRPGGRGSQAHRARRYHHLPAGDRIDRWMSIAEQAAAIDVDSRTILYVGRLAPNKGVALLIEGFALLAAKDASVRHGLRRRITRFSRRVDIDPNNRGHWSRGSRREFSFCMASRTAR